MSKAVIYARFSCENQREESIEGQVRECSEYAERNGMEIIHVYADRALSAKTDDRPDFQRMIKDSAKRQFEYVIVWKLDRFARNRYDSAIYKAKLKQSGVRLVSAKEQISDGPEGIILETVLEGMAEYYSAELSVKVRRGLKENALKCKYSGGNLTVGYKIVNQQYVLDEVNAPVIRKIFQMYADGANGNEVLEMANSMGFRTSRGKPLSRTRLNFLLHNKKYIGTYTWNDIEIEDGIPAIIDKETFERVQRRMEKNKYAAAASKAEERYELTTKLFCGYCGYPMVGESCKAHGNTYRYYSCGERKRGHGCKKKPVNKDWIERYVAEETARTILTDSMIEQIAVMMVEQLSQESSLLPSLEHQLKDTQKKIDNFVHAIEQGIFNEHTQQRMAELDLLKSDLEYQIIQEKLARPMFSKENIIAFLKHFQDGNVDDSDFRRELFDTFVNAIFLFDDKIVLTYNGRKGAVTLKLAEVKEAAGLGESFPDRCSDSSTFSPPAITSQSKGLRGFVFLDPCRPIRQPRVPRNDRSNLIPAQTVRFPPWFTIEYRAKDRLFRANDLFSSIPADIKV